MVNPKSALLVGLLAAGFAYQPNSTSAPSRAAQDQHVATAGASVTYDKTIELRNWPVETIYQSFIDKAQAREAAKAVACLTAEALACDGINFIIATVPDPQNTHYPIDFDRLVESIQRGLDDSRFTLDRFWLPWDSEPVPVDTDFIMHEQHKDWLLKQQTNPGVLVFRSNDNLTKLCVLLVGENPVTGVNKLQFANALKTMAHFSGDPHIFVLGPTFSGSISSLGSAIASLDKSRNYQFHVITGTATGDDNSERLQRASRGASLQYTRFAGSDEIAIKTFLAYATKKTSDDHIALLSESGTTYSEAFASYGIRTFHYPLQISRMRNAYGDDPELLALAQTKVGGTPRQGLQIPLKDEHETEDVVPSFSNNLRPVAQEAALLNVLATMSHSRVEYVGIVATDILDSMFLGRLLKDHCPNIRPFILNSDLLYGHVSQHNVFDGMLLVTNYPLIRKPNLPQFSSASEQGEYRATLKIFADLMHQKMDGFVDNPTIAVMGRDGIWPVTQPGDANPTPSSYPARQPFGWILFFTVTSLVCVAFAALIIHFNFNTHVEHLPLGWLSALQTNTLGTRITLSAGCLLLISFFAFAALLELKSGTGIVSIGGAACVVTFASLFSAISCCWGQLRTWHILLFALAAILFCFEVVTFLPVSPSFVSRSLHIGSGVSPIVPIAFLTSALLWLVCCHLNRQRLLHLFPERSPAFTGDSFLANAEKLHDNLLRILGHWVTGSYAWSAVLLTLLVFSLIILDPRKIFSLETFRFEWIYTAALYMFYFGLLVESTRFLRAWSTLHSLLRMLERHVLCEAFKRLPNELSPGFLWRFGGGGHGFLVLAHFLNRLKRLADQQQFRFDRTYVMHFDELRQDSKELMSAGAAIQVIGASSLKKINKHIEEVFVALVAAMSHEWGTFATQEQAAAAAVAGSPPTGSPFRHRSLSSETHPLAEEMIALRFVELIAQVNLHLKNNIEFMAGGLILAVISLNSYPFEPHHSMTSMVTVYFFIMSSVFLMVFMQMSRNTIISYLSDTEPGRLDGSLFHVLSYGGLPLLTVISSQFPSVGGFLFAWVKPALETLR